jgi:hypothetical protein
MLPGHGEVKKKELPKNMRKFRVKDTELTDKSVFNALPEINLDSEDEKTIFDEF